MDVNVRFRFNKATGEVEIFEVDQEIVDDDAEHNREHDLLAAKIGGLLEKAPRVIELPPDGAARRLETATEASDGEEDEDLLLREI